MTQRFLPGLFDRLIGDRPNTVSDSGMAELTLDQLKDAVAADLQALLNTRAAHPQGSLDAYPECQKSILNYGLIDFCGMCLTSSVDREKICSALTAAIERHEPRLHNVRTELRFAGAPAGRLDFAISGVLIAAASAEPVHFDAALDAANQKYSIRQTRHSRATRESVNG